MANTEWHKYFKPKADRPGPPISQFDYDKGFIEDALANARNRPEIAMQAMEWLRTLLPERPVIVAQSMSDSRDFARVIHRPNAIVLNIAEQLMGMEDFHILFVGRFENHQYYNHICQILKSRRSYVDWTIRDWS